jgi:hypothetical protein
MRIPLRLSLFLSHRWAQAVTLYLTGFASGLIAGHGRRLLMPAVFIFIAIFRLTITRLDRWVLPLGYYGAYMITMFPGAAIFFGHAFNPFGIALLWLSFSVLLAAPWALLCTSDPVRLSWAVPCVIALETVPPLGLFSIGNPLNCAGVLFPHTRWFGLALLLVLASLVALRPRYALPLVLFLAVGSTLFIPSARPLRGWQAISTRLGGQGLDTPDMMRDYATAEFVQSTALRSDARVVVFPESIVQWNASTEAFWNRTLATLRAQRRTLVLGAIVMRRGPRGAYRNVALGRGAMDFIFDQRIPIPVTMWKIFGNGGVPLNLQGPGTLLVGRDRAAVLICYEQLLAWPIIMSIQEHPRVLVGLANDYWAKGTYFPAIQAANMEAWGRLFNLPVLTAVNQ